MITKEEIVAKLRKLSGRDAAEFMLSILDVGMSRKIPAEVGDEWKDTIAECKVCFHKDGFQELDGMGTVRCAYCGARYIPTFSGVQHVGDWDSYACKERFNPPLKVSDESVTTT